MLSGRYTVPRGVNSPVHLEMELLDRLHFEAQSLLLPVVIKANDRLRYLSSHEMASKHLFHAI